MVSIKDAFVDAWRSHRTEQGDDPASLPDPLGAQRAIEEQQRRQRRREKRRRNEPAQVADHGEDSGAGGGFLLEDDDAQDNGGGGGFLLDEEGAEDGEAHQLTRRHGDTSYDADEAAKQARFIPLSSVPDALTNLSLPSTDETVLKLFRDVAINQDDVPEAEGVVDGSRRRRRGPAAGPIIRVVTLADFERIAEVLTAGQKERRANSNEDADSEEAEASTSRRGRPCRAAAASSLKRLRAADMRDDDPDDVDGEDSDDEDQFKIDAEAEEDGDDDVQAIDDFRPAPTRRKRGAASGSGAATKTPRKSTNGGARRAKRRASLSDDDDDDDDLRSDDQSDAEEAELKLSVHQRKQVVAAFALLTERLAQVRGASTEEGIMTRFSKDDLRALVRAVGEKIPEKEIDEMVDEGLHYFAAASSPDATQQSNKLRREAEAGRIAAANLSSGTSAGLAPTLGIDEFAGVLLKGRLI